MELHLFTCHDLYFLLLLPSIDNICRYNCIYGVSVVKKVKSLRTLILQTPTTPKVVPCGDKKKLFSPNGTNEYMMALVKSPVRKGRRSVPSPIKFDQSNSTANSAGSQEDEAAVEKEEADSAEIADSVANILTTLEDNPGDELTDTGNEMSQVTPKVIPLLPYIFPIFEPPATNV